LGKRCELLECMSKNDKSNQHNEKQKTNYNKQTSQSKHQIVQTVINKSCIHCKSELHMVFKCPEFLNLSTSDRIKTINNLKACRNCFKLNHTASACKSVNKSNYYGPVFYNSLSNEITALPRNKFITQIKMLLTEGAYYDYRSFYVRCCAK
jgi:hypothetical protein